MRRRRQPGVSFESLESRIALSVANDHNPLYGVSLRGTVTSDHVSRSGGGGGSGCGGKQRISLTVG